MPVAHVGHWIGYVLYAIPVIILVVGAITSNRIARRRAAEESRDTEAETGRPKVL